jgi:hypothetical protein
MDPAMAEEAKEHLKRIEAAEAMKDKYGGPNEPRLYSNIRKIIEEGKS